MAAPLKALLFFCALFCFTLPLRATQCVDLLFETFVICEKARPQSYDQHLKWAQCFHSVGANSGVTDLSQCALYDLAGNQCATPETYERLLADLPKNDFLLNAAAWTYYLSGTNLERAFELIRQIQEPSLHSEDTYALIELHRGFPANALQRILPLLEQAAIREGAEYELNEYVSAILLLQHAGTILYRNQRLVFAAKCWAEAYTIADFLIKQDPANECMLLIQDYDHQKMAKRIAAISALLP